MNVIQIVSDSLRRDHLGCYGNPGTQRTHERIRTPHLDRLAAEALLFENYYTGSFPTLPNRNDLFTGRYSFRQYSWQALPPGELPVAALLSAAGVKTELVGDNPHLISSGHDFDRGFGGSEWIRGQEDEKYRTFPRHPPLPKPLDKWRNPDEGYLQYLRNVHHRRREAEYFPARTAQAAVAWLKENARDGDFFLHVEFFDPHEPFDPPPGYAEHYGFDRRQPKITYPRYGLSDRFTAGELENIRALYAGEVELVDKYVGRLLEAVEKLGLTKTTAIIFTSDHGYYLGDQGLQGKALVDPAKSAKESMPFYQELAHVPLLVRLPGVKPARLPALVQPVDLMPTLLELFGLVKTPAGKGSGGDGGSGGALFPPESVLTARGAQATRKLKFDPSQLHGRSIMPVLKGKARAHRSLAVTSYGLKFHDAFLARSALTDGTFTLHYNGRYGPEDEQRRTAWTEALKRSAGFRGGIEPFLVHLPSDPTEDRNLLAPGAETPPGLSPSPLRERGGVRGAGETFDAWAKARALHAQYVRLLEAIGTPEEHLAGRRWWPEGT